MQYKYFTSYKGRSVVPGQRVQVYRNVNKPEVTYSIRDDKTGLVLGHATHLLLTNKCVLHVSQAGRERVLREKRKNIHAWITGSFGVLHAGDDELFSSGVKVVYNPYEDFAFKYVEDVHDYKRNHYIQLANLVYINPDGVFASGF